MPATLPYLILALLLSACTQSPAAESNRMTAPDEAASPSRPLVVTELFTSEGCSSCPPADALLAELSEREGVIALSFHVDYWNYLGWSDPYSQEVFSERQRAYARILDGRVYTPELVVNGEVGLVGSNRRLVEAAIGKARETSVALEIGLEMHVQGDVVTANVSIEDVPSDAVLHLALVERSTNQDVQRGENRGRSLSHTNVVRVFETFAAVPGSHPMNLPEDLSPSNASVVAYVQDGEVGLVLGGAIAAL